MTPDKTPSDAEINQLIAANLLVVEGGQCAFESWADMRPELIQFARAVLAKWGSPVVAGEPWGASVGDRVWVGKLPTHVPKLAEEEGLPIQWLYTTPQPTRVQAGAVPPAGREPEFDQFLSDVLTAAGLVTHGKQCKQLGERLGAAVMKLRVHGIKEGGQHADRWAD